MAAGAGPATDRPDPSLDPTRIADQLNSAIDQVARLVAAVPDPTALAAGRWTVHDVAAHIAAGLALYTDLIRGGASPAGTIDAIADMNDDLIAVGGEATMPMLAERIRAAAADYLAAASLRPAGSTVSWHTGLTLPVSSLLAISVGEATVHGLDIATVTRAPWPVPSSWARTVFHGVLPVLPYYLRSDRAAGRHQRFDVRLRGPGSDRTLFTIADATLRISAPDGGPVDCHISAQPWAMVQVLYARLGPVRAAANGRITAWGRRPWLALQLPSLFRKP
jgi:uncharacterized protein (TIGR03083 family)